MLLTDAYIGLYNDPTNSDLKCYRGLYRGNDLSLYESNNKALSLAIDDYLSIAQDGFYTEYNKE